MKILIYALLSLTVMATSGCAPYILSEPYPAFELQSMSFDALPENMKTDFSTRYPNALITNAVFQSFQGKHTGYVIWFDDSNGEKRVQQYPPGGPRKVEPQDSVKEDS